MTLLEELARAARRIERACAAKPGKVGPRATCDDCNFATALRARAAHVRELAPGCPAWCDYNEEHWPSHSPACPRGLYLALTGPLSPTGPETETKET